MSSTIYLIVADNGRSYDEHEARNVCAFTTKLAADQFAAEATAEAKRIDDEVQERRQRYFDNKLKRFPSRPKNWLDPEASDELWVYYVSPLSLHPRIPEAAR